jgi:hypothetical protein
MRAAEELALMTRVGILSRRGVGANSPALSTATFLQPRQPADLRADKALRRLKAEADSDLQ